MRFKSDIATCFSLQDRYWPLASMDSLRSPIRPLRGAQGDFKLAHQSRSAPAWHVDDRRFGEFRSDLFDVCRSHPPNLDRGAAFAVSAYQRNTLVDATQRGPRLIRNLRPKLAPEALADLERRDSRVVVQPVEDHAHALLLVAEQVGNFEELAGVFDRRHIHGHDQQNQV